MFYTYNKNASANQRIVMYFFLTKSLFEKLFYRTTGLIIQKFFFSLSELYEKIYVFYGLQQEGF